MSGREKIVTRKQANKTGSSSSLGDRPPSRRESISSSSSEELFHDTVNDTVTKMAATAPVFTIEFFDEQSSIYDRWVKRLEGALKIFGITDAELRVHYLLHFIGKDAYDTLCDAVNPVMPETMPFDQISKWCKNHFNPAPLEIAEIYKFQSRLQQQGEPVRDYVTELRKLSTHCNFGEYLQKALRNQFVCGLRKADVKRKLLGTKDLTFNQALEIAYSFEATEEKSAEMTSPFVNETHKIPIREVNYVRQNGSNKNPKQVPHQNPKQDSSVRCYRCTGQHLANVCKYVDSVCNFCNKKGHLGKACFKKNRFTVPTNMVQNDTDEHEEYVSYLNHLEDKFFLKKLFVKIKINDVSFNMELDSGSAYSIICLGDMKKFGIPEKNIDKTNVKLKSYTGNVVSVLGAVFVNVDLLSSGNIFRRTNLRLLITGENRQPLFGREWIIAFKGMPLMDAFNILNSNSSQAVNAVENTDSVLRMLEGLLKEYEILFGEEAGVISGEPAAIELKENARPIFIRARQVPYALRSRVEAEIDHLVQENILVPVNHSEWATPIVPVVKGNGKIRICGDFKTTLNKHLLIDEHPLPTTDDLFTVLNGGDKFSKIDLRKAYLQWSVREEDQSKLTLSTHKGLFKCTRLLFGLSSAPAKWQRKIESILSGIEGVVVFIDDICVTGPDNKTHLARLREVFERLKVHGLRVNKEKTQLFCDSIEYCGYKIDREGIHKTDQKVQAILNAAVPKNISEVRSLLGLINYYGRFFKNLSDTLEPLHNLIRRNTVFEWNDKCKLAFERIKQEMSSENFLVHYDTNLPLCLATDASPVGVGAVLSHTYPDGTERPIYFASQTLSETQRKWSQIDKEAYAIVFGIKKFYQFIYGRSFILYTDHKPLVQIFSPDKSLPHMTASRMQHYAIFLQGFQYQIRYKRSEMNSNADGLSRLPMAVSEKRRFEESDVFELHQIDSLPVTAEDIARETVKDDDLKILFDALLKGHQLDSKKRFFINQEEFTIQSGCIMRGIRVVVPVSLRSSVLADLHEVHFGITRMKELARSFCWWPGIDKNIEELASNCRECANFRPNPEKVETHHWEYPSRPFERIHIDYAGPFQGVYFLLVVDAYSKWTEVYITKRITTEATIPFLRLFFATFGLPKKLCSDNGVQFTSYEFEKFLKSNGITHKKSAPFHPATNGQVERYVQTIKKKLKCLSAVKDDLQTKLLNILIHYRITPHPETGQSPSDMVFNYKVGTKFSMMTPEKKNDIKQLPTTPSKTFMIGDRVAVRDYGSSKWKFGCVEQKEGLLHYHIRLEDGRVWRRHIDQMCKAGRFVNEDKEEESLEGWPNLGLKL